MKILFTGNLNPKLTRHLHAMLETAPLREVEESVNGKLRIETFYQKKKPLKPIKKGKK